MTTTKEKKMGKLEGKIALSRAVTAALAWRRRSTL